MHVQHFKLYLHNIYVQDTLYWNDIVDIIYVGVSDTDDYVQYQRCLYIKLSSEEMTCAQFVKVGSKNKIRCEVTGI